MTATTAPLIALDRFADAAPAADRLETARFIDLVTYRRTGEPVGTTVLFIPDGDRLLVRTARASGKVKRLAHTSRVELTPADSRGRHTGRTLQGTARILDTDAVAPTRARLHARYRIAGPLFSVIRRMRGQGDVIVEITIDLTRPATPRMATIEAATFVSRRIASTGTGSACLLFLVAVLAAGCAGSAAADADVAGAASVVTPAPTAAADAEPVSDEPMSAAGDACALFTADQAAAVLGEPVGSGELKTSATFGSEACRYTSTGSAATIALWLHPTSDRTDWEEEVTKLGGSPDLAVPSIGEAAYRLGGSAEQSWAKVAVFDAGHDFWLEVRDAAAPVEAADAAVALAHDLVMALR